MSLLVWHSRLEILRRFFPGSCFLATSVAIKKGGVILIPDTFYETSFLLGSL